LKSPTPGNGTLALPRQKSRMCVCAKMHVPKLAMLRTSWDHGGRDLEKAVNASDVRSEKVVVKAPLACVVLVLYSWCSAVLEYCAAFSVLSSYCCNFGMAKEAR